jgi:hypothetical protein
MLMILTVPKMIIQRNRMITINITRRISSRPLPPTIPINATTQLSITRLITTPGIQQRIPRIPAHEILQQTIEAVL